MLFTLFPVTFKATKQKFLQSEKDKESWNVLVHSFHLYDFTLAKAANWSGKVHMKNYNLKSAAKIVS